MGSLKQGRDGGAAGRQLLETALVRVASGRVVAVRSTSAARASRTVVFCHPAPGSAAFDPDPTETAARDVSLLGVDRPGYGLSEPVAGGAWATVASAADDIAQVLLERGAPRVGVVGWSAGGRVALALAARHPELVDRVAVVATPAPHEAVPWVPEEHVAGLAQLAGLDAEAVHSLLRDQLGGTLPDDARADAAFVALGASAADAKALAWPGAKGRLAGMLQEAYRQGATGMASDIAGYSLRPWGFEPGEVRAKTLLLYGAADPAIGHRHARWWHEQLPASRVEMAPAAGHLLVIPLWRRILSHLAPGTLR